MADITEKKKRHYSGLDADKASIPAGGKEPGDSYFATDKLKLYYWQGGDWKTGLGYEYVPRAITALDFDETNFTRDGNWHVDGLDLTGIVPAGAVAVHFELYLKDNAIASTGQLRANATTKAVNVMQNVTVVANQWTVYMHGILYIDADRLVDYHFTNAMNDVGLTILGWFI